MAKYQNLGADRRKADASFLTALIRPLAPIVLAVAAAHAPAMAQQQAVQDWQEVDAMTQNVARALGREAAPIDRRIKLAKCPERPEISAMNANSLAVRCPTLGWRLRVAMLGVGGRAMEGDYTALPAAAAQPRQRSEPPTIRRGDAVRVSIETASYSVSYSATATQDGRLGEAIALRGADAKNPIIAVVSGPGQARIDK